MSADSPALPVDLFTRIDEQDDSVFYDVPRFVLHVDQATTHALARYFDELMAPDAAVLDLMSSWISHLPGDAYETVVCHGMNAEELAGNPRADEWFVQDLNRKPILPCETARFDHVLISFSVQYLTDPVSVFADIARVLRPGGSLIVAMSHRCFPTKAIRAFHVLSMEARIRFVARCIRLSGGFDQPVFADRSPDGVDPLWILKAVKREVA